MDLNIWPLKEMEKTENKSNAEFSDRNRFRDQDRHETKERLEDLERPGNLLEQELEIESTYGSKR